MFKVFWDQNRNIIEAAAILSALGALFLSVPQPESPAAREALSNIQVIWLLLTSIAILACIAVSLRFIVGVTKSRDRRDPVRDLSILLAYVILMVTGWLTVNFWRYMLEVYGESLRLMFQLLRLPFLFLALILAAVGFAKIAVRVGGWPRPVAFMVLAAVSAAFGLVGLAIIGYPMGSASQIIWMWLYGFVVMLGTLAGMIVWRRLRSRREKGRET